MRRMKLMFSVFLVALFFAGNVMAEQVVVTGRGKKYHKPTCRTVQNREVRTLEKEEALKEGYTACRRCYKEDVVIEEVTKDQKELLENKEEDLK